MFRRSRAVLIVRARKCRRRRIADASDQFSFVNELDRRFASTRFVSRAARRSNGSTSRKKKSERIQKPLAVLAYRLSEFTLICERSTYDNTVVNCEYGKLVQPSNKVPASGDVSSDEYYNSEYREWVHKSAKA